MRSMVAAAVSQTTEEEARVLEKDYHTPPRPNASSRSSRNVPELCTYEPPSTTWTPPLALSSSTFVGRGPRDVDDDLKCDVLLDTRTGREKTHTHSIKPPFIHPHL